LVHPSWTRSRGRDASFEAKKKARIGVNKVNKKKGSRKKKKSKKTKKYATPTII